MAEIPMIETERLILTGPTSTDLADCVTAYGDPEVVRHLGGVPFTEEDTWGRLLRNLGHWQLLGYGTWIVRERGGDFVGEIGFFDLHRSITASITPALDIPEMGWVLAKRAHGKGYATEAVQAAIRWGGQHIASRTYGCMIDVDNVASQRVAAKCGFRERARSVYKGAPVILMRRES